MRKLALVVGVVLVAGIAVAAWWKSDPDEPKPVRKIADPAELIAALETASPSECAHYQQQLVARGMDVLPQVKQALAVAAEKPLAGAEDQERYRLRLKAVIARLCQPRWRSGLSQALAEAKDSGRMVMVFSTVGGVNGFS